AGVVAEVRGEPPVVVRRLPVPRAPRVVAQAEAGDLPAVVADRDGAGRLHELLVVALGELLARPLVRLLRLAAEHVADTSVVEVGGDLHPLALGERLARI